MKQVLSFFLVLLLTTALGSSLVLAEPVARGFGFGGAMGMAFFPDMTGINGFLSENGLPSMGSVLIGAGGNGRGGAIGDLVFGGVGWGLMGFSQSDNVQADLVSAGGGFDLGAAIGGGKDSVLTLGVVLGAGANVLTLSSVSDNDDNGDNDDGVTSCGIIPGPTSRELVHVNGFAQPYVSMSAQLLPWMGFEFRLGYIFPVVSMDVGDLVGIPAPSLEMSGPTVSLGLVFGGIDSGQSRVENGNEVEAVSPGKGEVVATSSGSFVLAAMDELFIENSLGDIVISSYALDATQTDSALVVEWQAVRTARQKQIDTLQVVVNSPDLEAALSTTGTGRIDYVLRIPVGVDLRVKNGVGNITLVNHEAQTIIIENGGGEVDLRGVRAEALIVSGGIGAIDLSDVDAQQLIVNLGVGEIGLGLPVSASARIVAKAAIGDVSIDRFPGMTGGVHGFLGKSGNVTLGLGERMVELHVGLGEINIEMRLLGQQ